MEYNPKWVIYSGDDMYKIDEIGKLKDELKRIDMNKIMAVYAKPSSYHTVTLYISEINTLERLYSLYRNEGYVTEIRNKYGIKYAIWARETNRHPKLKRILKGIITKKIEDSEFINSQSFGIYSSVFIKQQSNLIFDENYVNSTEEVDLSYYIKLSKTPYRIIDYQIGDLQGSTLGTGITRRLRIILGDTYFFNKYQESLWK